MRNALRLLPVAVLLGLATTASASGPATFAEAKELATAQEKPLLVDFFATWCGPCKAFAKAVETDGDVQGALADVVLFTTDAEKGEGLDLAKLHKVQGYPTFVLATAQGEPMDTWSGYGKEYFLDHLREALADPTTVEQKRARFAGSPTPGDAEKLARYYSTTGENERAVELYRQASELGAPSDFAYEIFEAMVYGYSKQDLFSPEEIRKAADRVVAGKDRDADALVQTYYLMQRVEKKAQSGDVATPYLVPAMKAIEGNEEYAGTLASLKVEHALRVEKDPEAAFEAKIAAQPEGWKDSPGRLNSVAWWCFENHVRLDEAQALAERGVKLAPPGDDRASILDTLAEICNARGNCPEAVTWIRQAVQEAPEKEYYRKQLERFEALAAEMN